MKVILLNVVNMKIVLDITEKKNIIVSMHFNALKLEKFDAPSGRTTPYATFSDNGRMYVSSAATKLFGLEEKKYPAVNIYYNVAEKVMALKFLEEQTDGALSFKSAKHGGGFVNCKSFAITYDMMQGERLSGEYVGKYILEKGIHDTLGEVFFVNLKEKKQNTLLGGQEGKTSK